VTRHSRLSDVSRSLTILILDARRGNSRQVGCYPQRISPPLAHSWRRGKDRIGLPSASALIHRTDLVLLGVASVDDSESCLSFREDELGVAERHPDALKPKQQPPAKLPFDATLKSRVMVRWVLLATSTDPLIDDGSKECKGVVC
jgi:hypothetical protein